jgi:hypothetical protein
MTMLGETRHTIQSRTVAKRAKAMKGLVGEPKKSVDIFIKADKTLQQLSLREGTTELAKATLTEQLVAFDIARDTILPDLAVALIAAKLTPRLTPFKGFSKHSPGALARLSFSEETKAIEDLCASVLKANPPASVKTLVKSLLKENAKVAATLEKLDAPKAAHEEAFIARNRFMPEWQKALSNLRVQMKAALVGRPGAYEALFAPE